MYRRSDPPFLPIPLKTVVHDFPCFELTLLASGLTPDSSAGSSSLVGASVRLAGTPSARSLKGFRV